jgi:heme exporter protein B
MMGWRRERTLAWRRRSELLNPLLFNVLVVLLFPLGLSPEPDVLSPLAHGVLWVAALLATLLSLDLMYRFDLQDGTLEQVVVSGTSLPGFILTKILLHWVYTGLALTLMVPVLGLMLFLPLSVLPLMMGVLGLGTLFFCAMGAIGAALVAGLRRSGLLLSLLVIPLYIPVLIMGTGAVSAAMAATPYIAPLATLGALTCLALASAPWVAASAIRLALNES